jgi:tripartite-type tricarboxylate transporter receptor subunit TctC
MRRRDLLALGAGALATRSLTLQSAVAQSKYPDRPIRLVIPFPPGGGYDAVGRPWAEKMKSVLGTVVVENQGEEAVRSVLPQSPAPARMATPSS